MATSPHQKAKSLFDNLGLSISQHVYCPICAQIMKNPVRLNGIKESTFCAFCISQWLQKRKMNPMTKEPLTDVVLIPDRELNAEIRELYDGAKKACDWLIVSMVGNDCSEADDAIKWFNDHLLHLQSAYEWAPWMQETALNGIQSFIKQFTARSAAAEIYDAQCFEKPTNDDGENWKHEIEEIRKSGKKIIDDRCDAAVQQINTLSTRSNDHNHDNDSGSKGTIKNIMMECKRAVKFISAIIKGISNVFKIVSGWLLRFLICYVKKTLKWLSKI
eukprot:128488_1